MSITKYPSKNLVVPLDGKLKEEVKIILSDLGLNQSQVVSALYKEIARTKRVPLSFDLNDARKPTKAEQVAIDDYLNRKSQKGYKTYSLESVLKEIKEVK